MSSAEVVNVRIKTESEKPSELSEGIADLPMCSVVIEKLDEVQEMQRIKQSSKLRANAFNQSNGSASTAKVAIEEKSSNKSKQQKTNAKIPKNFDKTITIKSKKCVICSERMKVGTNHYVTCHEGFEIYCARISASKSDKLRQLPPKPAHHENSKILAFCHYCEKALKIERSKWIDHILQHTGEYTWHCKSCSSLITILTKKTSVCTHSDIQRVPMVDFNDTLFVYMCNNCNYTQCLEENMKNHIRNTHEIKVNISVDQYTRIVLIPNFKPSQNFQGYTKRTTTNNSDSLKNLNVFRSSEQGEQISLSSTFLDSFERIVMHTEKQPKQSRNEEHDKRQSMIHGLKFKNEKPDETVDFLSLEKQEICVIPKIIKRVDNITLQTIPGTQKFQCNIGNCDFISINNPRSLSNHLRIKHTEAWMGYCHSCIKQIHSESVSLMKELEHLTAFHLPTSTATKQATEVSKPETNSTVNKLSKIRARQNLIQHYQRGGIVPMKIDLPEPPKQPFINVTDPPRIKVRRLSGDKLSANSTQNIPIELQLPVQPSSFIDFNISTQTNNAADYNGNPFERITNVHVWESNIEDENVVAPFQN